MQFYEKVSNPLFLCVYTTGDAAGSFRSNKNMRVCLSGWSKKDSKNNSNDP
jgi:hypothetical protein